MSYLTDESGGLDPIELFEFTYGITTWRFTDGDAPYIHPTSGLTYTPETISRGTMTQSDEDGSMSVEVVVDALAPIADFFRTPFLPAQQIWLTIYRTHVGSVDVATIFRGRAGQCVFDGKVAKITCIPTRAAITKRIPVQLVQMLCNNTLYDGRCKADPNAFKSAGTITAINGLTFTLSGALSGRAAGFFDGGFIGSATKPAATILDHTVAGAVVTLKMLYNPGYIVGDVIDAFAGCDKRFSTCITKFANQIHHQGFPNFPAQDPFVNEVL
jgi:uncharacterized phage protein (TIGR02218 family)